MAGTFLLVTFGLIIFRAATINQALEYITGICDKHLISLKAISDSGLVEALVPLVFAVLLFVIEWIYRDTEFPLSQLGTKWKVPFRYAMYYAIIIAIFWFGGIEQQFIYFKF